MILLKFTLFLTTTTTVLCVPDMSDGTIRWLSRNKYVFQSMTYSEKTIMNLEHNPKEYITGKIEKMKIFWTKNTTAPTCSSNWKWWFDFSRQKRALCSTCCSTEFKAIAPITIDYSGTTYDVYHPSGGWQILFLGECAQSASCSFGRCVSEEDYHTWILVLDPAMNYDPQIRFVPVSYPKYCKCVNSL